MAKFIAFLKVVFTDFLGVAPDALKGHLSPVEITRLVLTMVLAAFGMGGATGVVDAIVGPLAALLTPTNMAAISAVFSGIVQIVRMLGHGAPVPVKTIRG